MNINIEAKKKRNEYIEKKLIKNQAGTLKVQGSKSEITETVIEEAARNRKSLIYNNKRTNRSQIRILGKKKESAIRSDSRRKSIGKYAKTSVQNAISMPYNTVRLAADQIKEVAINNKIKEITESKNANDMVQLAGEHGLRAVVKAFSLVSGFMMSTIGNLLKTIILAIIPYFVIASVVLLVVFIPVTFGSNATGSEAGNGVSIDTSGPVVGTVKQPRLEGTATELTYKEVNRSPWYSGYVSSNGSPFVGDNGLDRIRGDRGGNCTAYAWGRRCELEGRRTDLGSMGDAYCWYIRELESGIYKCGQKAKVGAVVCWSYGTGVNGHVAIIEQINKDGSIVTSNSAYGSTTGIPILFYNVTYENEQALKSAYTIFQGYIYLEKKK